MSIIWSQVTNNNETHKILWDFEVQTDPLIPARKPDLVITDKKKPNYRKVDFAILADHRLKIIGWKGGKVFRPWYKTKKAWNMKVVVILIVIGALGTIPHQRLGKGTGSVSIPIEYE